jgi:hypothetical protein
MCKYQIISTRYLYYSRNHLTANNDIVIDWPCFLFKWKSYQVVFNVDSIFIKLCRESRINCCMTMFYNLSLYKCWSIIECSSLENHINIDVLSCVYLALFNYDLTWSRWSKSHRFCWNNLGNNYWKSEHILRTELLNLYDTEWHIFFKPKHVKLLRIIFFKLIEIIRMESRIT